MFLLRVTTIRPDRSIPEVPKASAMSSRIQVYGKVSFVSSDGSRGSSWTFDIYDAYSGIGGMTYVRPRTKEYEL